ncbi:hypothetical protein PHLCEN_2v6931 [Hermanssonia centrifuga]|uniref:RING-type domain-containing protein n=1 Tax=Hermanssonia centrifuga TaxID=98765 RepID=A0A2R6NXY6_9APHY|nr:hypothetical protein PHLCEN_2v6931 [Hermanssonia centrifuga]
MPATRSAGSRRPLRPQPALPNTSAEIIVLSSDSEESLPRKVVPTRKSVKPKGKVRAKPCASPEDIIELTSGDEAPSAPSRKRSPHRSLQSKDQNSERRTENLENENRWLKEELRKFTTKAPSSNLKGTDLDRLRELEATVARSEKVRYGIQNERSPSTKYLSPQTMENLVEHITCEICTLRMWSPYTLSCGHTFCLNCLQDWFSTALVQHMTAHPNWTVNPRLPDRIRTHLNNPNLSEQQRQTANRQVQAMHIATPQPKYTCPSCRHPVTSKPSEVFIIKDVVRTIAGAEGEKSPKRNTAGRRPTESPWDGFFPTLA